MYFTTDTVCGAVQQPSTSQMGVDGIDMDAVAPSDFEAARTVQLRDDAIVDAFGTDEFVWFDTVVARPIEQTYRLDGDEYTFKKTSEALREATFSLDRTPFPLRHPETGVVQTFDDAHGFNARPRYVDDYDENGDAVVVSTFIPGDDTEAARFIDEYGGGVSVGFYNDLEWHTDEASIDAYQTDLYFDHVAGVEEGRCSREDGCGVLTDAVTEAIDSEPPTGQMRTATTVSPSDVSGPSNDAPATTESSNSKGAEVVTDAREGSWMQWDWSGGTAYGKVVETSSDDPLSASGNTREPTDDRDAVKLRSWDDDSESWDSMVVKLEGENNLRSWDNPPSNPPSMDAAPPSFNEGDVVQWRVDPEMVGRVVHNPSDEPYVMVDLLDDEMESMGWTLTAGYADIEHHNSMSTSMDSAHGEMTTKAGVTFRDTRDGKLDESAIPNDDYESHYLYDRDTKTASSYPVVDADGYLRRGNVESAYELGARGGVTDDEHDRNLKALNDEFDNPPIDESKFMSDADVNGESIDLIPPEAAQNAAQQVLDANDDEDTTVNGMTETGWSRARQLASGEELAPADIVGGSDGMAVWWSRHAGHTLSMGETMRLKGADKDNPFEDNSYTAGKGWGGVSGAKWAIRKGNEIKRARDEDADYSLDSTTMTDDNDSDIELTALVSEMSLDSIADKHDGVADLQSTLDEKDNRIDVLEDKVETLTDETEALEAELESYRATEKEQLVDDITDLTSAWDEDSLMDEALDELETKKQIATDAASSPSTPTDNGGDNEDEPTVDTANDDMTVSNEHRSWA